MKDDYSLIVKDWLIQDEGRSTAIALAADLGLKDWCLAAGFVRNLVWDKLHGYEEATPLNDIDLIYYDESYCSEIIDRTIEKELMEKTDLPWSVKNQARMHMRNDDAPYHSTEGYSRRGFSFVQQMSILFLEMCFMCFLEKVNLEQIFHQSPISRGSRDNRDSKHITYS